MSKPNVYSPNAQMPLFAFRRQRDIEKETGLALAGRLVVDIPKGTELTSDHVEMIETVLCSLDEVAKAGRLLDIIFGWEGEAKPANAANVEEDGALVAAWAATRVTVDVGPPSELTTTQLFNFPSGLGPAKCFVIEDGEVKDRH